MKAKSIDLRAKPCTYDFHAGESLFPGDGSHRFDRRIYSPHISGPDRCDRTLVKDGSFILPRSQLGGDAYTTI